MSNKEEVLRLNECIDMLLSLKTKNDIYRILIELRRGFSSAMSSEICSSVRYENKIRVELLDKIIKSIAEKGASDEKL